MQYFVRFISPGSAKQTVSEVGN